MEEKKKKQPTDTRLTLGVRFWSLRSQSNFKATGDYWRESKGYRQVTNLAPLLGNTTQCTEEGTSGKACDAGHFIINYCSATGTGPSTTGTNTCGHVSPGILTWAELRDKSHGQLHSHSYEALGAWPRHKPNFSEVGGRLLRGHGVHFKPSFCCSISSLSLPREPAWLFQGMSASFLERSYRSTLQLNSQTAQ